MTDSSLPWESEGEKLLGQVRDDLSCTSLLLALAGSPEAKGRHAVLASPGFEDAAVAEYLAGGCASDALFVAARENRWAIGRVGRSDVTVPLTAGQHVVGLSVDASPDGRTAWWLVLGRPGEPFSEAEQRRAGLLLSLIKAAHDRITEPGLQRLTYADGKLLLADPRTYLQFQEDPAPADELATLVPAVLHQRWEMIEPDRAYDMIVSVGEEPRWVRVRQRQTPPTMIVELRPVTKEDPPAVGLVDDPRVARALGFLMDSYAQSPSLNDVARFVSTSAFHFHRLFSRGAGVSPKHYLLRTQLLMAKWRLRSSSMPVGDVARQTGFSSHGHFTATFHRVIGVSPTAYREEAWTGGSGQEPRPADD